MKRLLKNSIYIAIIAAILIMAVPMYEGSSTEITGDTPIEKAVSLESAANSTNDNNFARVFFNKYDPEKKSWLYSIMLNEPDVLSGSNDPAGQQAAQLKRQTFRGIVGKIFTETAKFDESAEQIVIKVILPIAMDEAGIEHGSVFKAEKGAVAEIRKNPESWDSIVDLGNSEPFLGFYSSMDYSETTEITGSTPIEKSESLVQFLNGLAINDFEEVFFEEYDSEIGVWKYTVLVTDPSVFSAGSGDQAQLDKRFRVERHWENIKALFVRTAEWDETARGIILKVIFPVPIDSKGFAYGFVYSVNELGVTNLKKYPKNWSIYVRAQSGDQEQILLIPQSILNEFVGGEMPVEGGPNTDQGEEK